VRKLGIIALGIELLIGGEIVFGIDRAKAKTAGCDISEAVSNKPQ
jgi:hypothetical protein